MSTVGFSGAQRYPVHENIVNIDGLIEGDGLTVSPLRQRAIRNALTRGFCRPHPTGNSGESLAAMQDIDVPRRMGADTRQAVIVSATGASPDRDNEIEKPPETHESSRNS
ncbi:hypothetical protein [Luteibacter sp.]|uniref:hypothetical protein n=1 Tax=Luteibacter sp. TaxID=1886636 RepID=UPI0025BDB34C|nr:hypothetical protein [Luteibacter sp.]